jgi:hypothetical protein
VSYHGVRNAHIFFTDFKEWERLLGNGLKRSTVELHLSGLIGTAIHPDMQRIRIIEFFKIVIRMLHWQSEVEKNLYKRLFEGTYLFAYK